jgi:ATP-binding cassette subfamily B protein
VAWRDPFEGVSLWDIARMVPRSASRTWRLAWRLDRPMLLVLVAAQLAQGLAAAVMLLATSSAMRPLLGAGTAEHRLRHAAGALVVVAVAAAAGRLATQVAVFCDKRITPIL